MLQDFVKEGCGTEKIAGTIIVTLTDVGDQDKLLKLAREQWEHSCQRNRNLLEAVLEICLCELGNKLTEEKQRISPVITTN